jgi:hypothetical protein
VLSGKNGATMGPALNLLWASRHIDYLRQVGAHVAGPASQLSAR